MSSSRNELFENAHKEFLGGLSDKEKTSFSTCSSPDELLATLGKLQLLSTQRQKKTLNRCLGVIKKLNDRLRPYFDALNVIASAQDTAAFAYGAFRIVLELASGFPTFFEKLITVLGRLANTFPQYCAIVELFENNPPARMQRHLESVYLDLFRFIQMAARIFTASSGKVKRPLGMITTVIWKPFDAQFDSLLNAMDEHRKFIIDELEIHQAQEAKDSERAAAIERERAAKERHRVEGDRKQASELAKQTEGMRKALNADLRASSIQRILEWLAPPQFVETLENSQEQRQEGTAEWVFDSPAYKKWAASRAKIEEGVKWNRMPPWVLWVHGNPGCGKTILASSVIEEVSDNKDSEGQLEQTCYFFFKYDDPKSSGLDSAYRSVLAQILHRNCNAEKMLDKFLFARSSQSLFSGQQRATSKELLDLVRVCAEELDQLTLILDGIDESNRPDSIGRKLKELVTTSPIKLILFSRPNVNSLHKLVMKKQRIAVDKEATSSDIRIFLEHQLQDLVENRKLPASAEIEQLADTLVHGADGMFLWAKLMTNYLNSFALSPHSRLATINGVRFPEGLNAMYDRIMTLITTSDTPQTELARGVLLWLNHVWYTGILTCEFLYDAVTDGNDDRDDFEDFPSIVISACGGLVEFNSQQVFQFTHLTVKDYIKEGPWSRVGLTAPLVPEESSAAIELTTRCLNCILSRTPTQPSAKTFGTSSGSNVFKYQTSFEGYAVRHWALHLRNSMSLRPNNGEYTDSDCALRMLASISRFMDNPLAVAFWIEGLYVQQSLATHEWIEEWVDLVSTQHSSQLQQTAKHLLEFSKEIAALDEEWGPKLIHNPSLIWNDVLIFSKVGVLSEIGRAVGAQLVTEIEPKAPKHDNGDNIQCLCTISSSTSDGLIMASLNVYPSSSFERFWKSIDPNNAYEEAEKFSSGWTAKYEIWSTESKVRIADAIITLPESEICLLIRQSFRQDPYKNKNSTYLPYSEQDDGSFDTSFPIALGHDCRTFSILRTIYTILPGDSSATGTCESCILPLESLKHFNAKWGSGLETFDPEALASLPGNCRVGWRDWYTYSISFSSTENHLGFADYQMPCRTHLAIFEIIREPQFCARLVRSTMIRSGPPRVKEMVFHGELPLVAFLSGNDVWVWDIHKETSDPTSLPDRCHRTSLSSCTLESLQFSACGMYLLARNKNDVEVFTVPQEMLASKGNSQMIKAESHRHLPNPASVTLFKPILGLPNTGLCPGSVLTDSYVVTIGESSDYSRALLVTTTNNELKLESVIPESLKDRDHLNILSLPQSFSTEGTEINLRIPTSLDDSLRIICNKRAAESYSLSDGRQGQFPSVIERKLTSVAQVQGSITSRLPPIKLDISLRADTLLRRPPKRKIDDVSGLVDE